MSENKNNSSAPESELSDEQREFIQQQIDDAKFRKRLRAIVKRWATALLGLLLGVTAGWDALQKLLAPFRGP